MVAPDSDRVNLYAIDPPHFADKHECLARSLSLPTRLMVERKPSWALRIALLLSAWLIGSGLFACQGEVSQVLELVALGTVVLVSPSDKFAATLEPMGVLPDGQIVRVLSCRPRKSNTQVDVMFNGRPAVVWKGNYRVLRRNARKGDANATSSCTGLAGHLE